MFITRPGLTPRSREKYALGVSRTIDTFANLYLSNHLQIFETTTEPHTYAAFAKYSRVGKSQVEPLTPAKSDKNVAINAFKQFFKQETGKDWEERTDGKMAAPKTDEDGNLLPAHQGWYALEGTGNLFTDWMKAYQAPNESVDDGSAPNDLPAPAFTKACLAENGLVKADHAESDHTKADITGAAAFLENAGEL